MKTIDACMAEQAISRRDREDTSARTAYAAGNHKLSKNDKIARMAGRFAICLILILIIAPRAAEAAIQSLNI